MLTSTPTRRILQNSIKNIRSASTTATASASTTMKHASSRLSSSSSADQAKALALITTTTAAGFLTLCNLHQQNSSHFNFEDEQKSLFPMSNKTTSCEVVMIGPIKEPSSGILFPQLCNGMQFVGCGVRVKYGFVKVYAVGTYMDPIAMAAIKTHGPKAISAALLNPQYPRTIRIVMNRSLSMDKYTAAIVEALEPRMNGQDLDKLEEFKKLNPKVDLVEGAEMEMTIRGSTMLYRNSVGGVGQIESEVFCKALCDVYYGADAVSPGHKEEVIKGVAAL